MNLKKKMWGRGVLIDCYTKNEFEYEIIVLDYLWIDIILDLQTNIYNEINDKDLYVQITRSEFIDVFNGMGLCLGVIVKDNLIAFRISSFGDDEIKKLADYCKIDGKAKVSFIEATAILKKFRGNRLQNKMTKLTMDYFKKENNFHYALSTVSPINIPSIKSLFHNEFEIIKLTNMYGSKLRYIFQYKFNKIRKETVLDILLVSLLEYNSIKEALNEGYRGVAIVFKNNIHYIKFVKD